MYWSWRICRRRRLAMCEFVEEQHRALRRRPPFQRRDMRERVKPAPVGGEQASAARGRARCRQGPAGCRARAPDRAGRSRAPEIRRSRAARGSAGRAMRSRLSAQASAERPALGHLGRGSRETAPRGGRRARGSWQASCGRRGRPNCGPKRVEMANIRSFISHAGANGGLSEWLEIWRS